MKTVLLAAALVGGWMAFARADKTSPDVATPVRYLQCDRAGKNCFLVARFINARACEKYRAMQAQIICVEQNGKPVCTAQPDAIHDSGRCE